MGPSPASIPPSTGSGPGRLTTTTVHVRLRQDLIEELRAIAEEDCSTVSTVVRRLVTVELRRRQRYVDPIALSRAGARDVNVRAS